MFQGQEQKRRSDAGILQITNRDFLVLTWISEQYCISFDHLQRLLGRYAKASTRDSEKLSISATRNAISRWIQLELIEVPRKIISEHPPYIWLSRRGLATLGLPYSHYQPKQSTIRHVYAINAIRLFIERLDIRWYPHRALTRDTQVRPQPDGEIREVQPSSRIAVIVVEQPFHLDITLSDMLSTVEAIAQRKRADSTETTDLYKRVWCYAHAEAAAALQQALIATHEPLSQNSEENRIVFYGLDAQQLSLSSIQQHQIAAGDETPDVSA
jgi:hypothetical protein